MITSNLESRLEKTYHILDNVFPNAKIELNFANDFELLIATVLSAQTKDVYVNAVTPTLFAKYPTANKLANAKNKDVENIIHMTGFFRVKTTNIINISKKIDKDFQGVIPKSLKDLISLPGVGRKTANVILGNLFNIPGLVVDTHFMRLSQRLQLSKSKNPYIVEREIGKLIPSSKWIKLSHLFVFQGRRICLARKPLCNICSIKHLCPSYKNI